MSEHDDWMAGLGVNVQALKAGSAQKPGTINLFPASLQNTASAPPSPPSPAPPPPPKPAPPPKDALARAGDGRPFWRPAPVGSTAPPAADKDWLEAFLRFYRTGPPSAADPSNMTCSFNGATITIAAALDIVDAQAQLNGYTPSRSTAAGLVKDLLKEGAESAALGDQVAGDVGGKGDLGADIAKLEALSMPKLLAALDRMKAQKKFESFTDRLPNASVRMGAAIVTVRGDFEDIQWQSALPKLSDDDRAAVMMRAPAKVRRITAGPAKAGDKPEDPIEVEAIVAAGKDGVEMQVKLTAHSPFGHSVGDAEGTFHIGPGGKLTQFELDITAFKAALTRKDSVAEVTVTVSGNATIDMAKGGSKIAPDGINAQVKAELAARLTRVPVLSGVTVKLTTTYGTGGGTVTGGLEFKIPGT
jgi:hypothetical protein